MGDPALLASKLREETEELIQALQTEDSTEQANEVIHEVADLLYFTLVAAASRGIGVDALRRELAHRNLRVGRRPMTAKPDEGKHDEGNHGEGNPDQGKLEEGGDR
jgi:phosphoribosyl-ATP pyrophosphohydrolase